MMLFDFLIALKIFIVIIIKFIYITILKNNVEINLHFYLLFLGLN